jgi:hypothetical protein
MKPKSFEDAERNNDIQHGIDLATILTWITKILVISNPQLPSNLIVKFTYFHVKHNFYDME